MRRRPNPWIAIPALMAGLFGGGLGWVVNDVACRSDLGSGCAGRSLLWGALGFLLGLMGMAVIMVLVARSIAEWREHREREPGDPRS
jgi:hypothetical protein